MENRIKECLLDLFADRTSATTMRANQLRLWFASMAYVLLCAVHRIALKHTQFADATCGTIRLKLLKMDALVRTSVRRIKSRWLRPAPINMNLHWPTRCSLTPQSADETEPADRTSQPSRCRCALLDSRRLQSVADTAHACKHRRRHHIAPTRMRNAD